MGWGNERIDLFEMVLACGGYAVGEKRVEEGEWEKER